MEIKEMEKQLNDAREQKDYWNKRIRYLEMRLFKAQLDERSKMFKEFLKEIYNKQNKSPYEISREKFEEWVSRTNLKYGYFSDFIKFLEERAKRKGWRLEYFDSKQWSKVKSGDTVAIKIHK